MLLATLTTKGQLTIPKKIRESLKLHAGDKIEFTVIKNRGAIIRPISKSVDEMFGKLHRAGLSSVSLEDIDDIVRNRMKDKFT